MNQIFSFKRYAWLLQCQWYENVVFYTIGIVLVVIASIMIYWSNVRLLDENQDFSEIQIILLITLGMFVMLAFGAGFFNKLHSKRKGMFYVSLPALPLERVAAAFTYIAVIVPLFFFVIFGTIEFVVAQIFSQVHGTATQMLFSGNFPSNVSVFTILLSFLSFSSISAFWSLVFGKKGAIATVFFIFGWTMLVVLIVSWLIEKEFYELPPYDGITIGNYLFVYLIPIWWILMYFVMKRKEVK